MLKKRPLIIIAGPTATGKSETAVKLCQRIGGEVISCDSMQVYRMMDIGSAKITQEEMAGVPHHLIDVLDPKEEFNLYTFLKLAKEAAEGIYARGHVPVLTGGTGFYIRAFLYDTALEEDSGDKSYRASLEEEAKNNGGDRLFEELKKVDPLSAETIDPHNLKRVIRALEFYHETGKRISQHNLEERAKESPYDFEYYVLTRPREELYARIEKRVDLMMEAGLLKEVEDLMAYGVTEKMTSMQGLGYKQLYQALSGRMTVEEAVSRIKIETRHFAKRQLTWFRKEKDVVWVDVSGEDFFNVYEARHQS